MTSRVFTNELVAILTDNLSGGATVFAYDSNLEQTLPCVVVGVESEEVHEGALLDNFILDAFVAVMSNGYDDQGNSLAENLKDQVMQILIDGHIISCLDGLFFMGANRVDGEDSTNIIMRFRVFTHTV